MTKHFTPMEASTIMRVMCAIERQIKKATYEGRYEDSNLMCNIFGRLRARQFMLVDHADGQGYYDSPLSDQPPTQPEIASRRSQ